MIDIHADDYALTLRTSEEMLALMKEGVLDSISIIPNTGSFDKCIDLLISEIPNLPFLPAMSVHLNIVEGISLSSGDGSLIDSTWKSLFLCSVNPFCYGNTKKALKSEINAQIRTGWDAIQKCMAKAKERGIACDQKKIRIDSHQHSHMIPIVWSAIMEVINENGYEVEYIRNSKEPLAVFLGETSLIGSYRPVNMVKNRILHSFSGSPDRFDRKAGRKPMYLWGLIMSGKMDADRIEKLLPAVLNKAEKQGRDLEILFHPGRMTEDELCPEIPKTSADDFYLSPNRDIEKEGARMCRKLVGPHIPSGDIK